MIDPAHELPVCRQAELMEISRSNVYYLPEPVRECDLVLMRRLDELHLNSPFAGARMLRDMLKLEGFEVGRKHVRTLMGKMALLLCTASPRRARHTKRIRSIPTCSTTSPSSGRTRLGPPTLPTVRLANEARRYGTSCLSMSGMHVL